MATRIEFSKHGGPEVLQAVEFTPRDPAEHEIQVFHESNGVTAIRSGLQEGEKVVASGLFLIDSEANIAGALERMRAQAPDAAASAAHAH